MSTSDELYPGQWAKLIAQGKARQQAEEEAMKKTNPFVRDESHTSEDIDAWFAEQSRRALKIDEPIFVLPGRYTRQRMEETQMEETQMGTQVSNHITYADIIIAVDVLKQAEKERLQAEKDHATIKEEAERYLNLVHKAGFTLGHRREELIDMIANKVRQDEEQR